MKPFFEKNPDDIQDVFSNAAPFYDQMNHWMSLGLHHTWKDLFVQAIDWTFLKQQKDCVFLDMACGSGDIAERLLQKATCLGLQPRIHLADKNPAMLETAKQKHAAQNWAFHLEDATQLSFPDQTFHLYTIAFGLRNIPDLKKALFEAWRVLKKGGLFYALEFSQPTSPFLHKFYQIYLKTWIPFLGNALTKAPASYHYLANSIQHFPKASLIKEMFDSAGFQNTGYQLIHKGILAIHWGQKKI